jgi:hypothetical protein
MPKYEPILDILQKRIDDPNYKPTGPTYGETAKAMILRGEI